MGLRVKNWGKYPYGLRRKMCTSWKCSKFPGSACETTLPGFRGNPVALQNLQRLISASSDGLSQPHPGA